MLVLLSEGDVRTIWNECSSSVESVTCDGLKGICMVVSRHLVENEEAIRCREEEKRLCAPGEPLNVNIRVNTPSVIQRSFDLKLLGRVLGLARRLSW